MRQTRKIGKLRHRLIAGIFCISLFAADVTAAIPVWASEPAAEQEQGAGEEAAQPVREDGGSQAQNPAEEKAGEGAQNPDEGKDGENAQNPEEKKDGENAQNPEDGKDGDAAQNPEDGKDGDAAQNPEDGEDEDATQNPEDKKDEEGVADNADDAEQESETPEGEETPGTGDQESVSENDTEEQEPSVSENTLQAQGEVRMLAVPADAIASGTYKSITWVVDKDGKLTVEGTGDFAEPDSSVAGDSDRAPWCKNYNTYYKIKSAEIRVTGMTDASYLFYGCSNLVEVNLDGFDTSTVTNMRGMFSGCKKLESIGFGQNCRTSKVTNMNSMFRNCYYLKNLDQVKTFDTSNVTDMSSMFQNCCGVDSLDLSGWDTGKVINMNKMFYDCNFTSLTLGGRFTTHNVTDMGGMFGGYYNDSKQWPYVGNTVSSPEAKWKPERWTLKGLDLAWLDLSGIDPSVNYDQGLRGIFNGCDVRQLDLGRLDTSMTTSLSGLFEGCTDMTGMDYSALKTDTITHMKRMFFGCGGRIENLGSLHTEHVTDMSYMFGSSGVRMFNRNPITTAIDLCGLDTSNVTDMSGMFSMSSSTSIDLSGLDTSKVTNMFDMFSASALTSVDLSGFDTSNVTNMANMFDGCSALTSVDLSGLDTSNVAEMGYMFMNCQELTEVNLGNLGTAKLQYNDNGDGTFYDPVLMMFYACPKLESLDLSNFDLINDDRVFWFGLDGDNSGRNSCESLKTLYTPYHIKCDIKLPKGDWYMADGTKLTDNCLPKNLSYSVLIQKGSKPAVSEARMEVSKKKTVYARNEEIKTDDLTVTYYGADGSIRKLTESDGQTDGYTTNAAELSTAQPGMLELIVTYTKDGKTLTATVALTVPYELKKDNVTVTLPSVTAYDYTYSGAPKTPEPSVTYRKGTDGAETVTLEKGKDYTVSYRNNVNACEEPADGAAAVPTAVITGQGLYSGTVTEHFSVHKAEALVTAQNLTVLMQKDGGTLPVGAAGVGTDGNGAYYAFSYKATGLLNGDTLTKVPSYTVMEDEAEAKPVTAIDISKAGIYYIHPLEADAGMNYALAYEPGILTVSEERVAYTVTLDGMGHCDTFTKSGIKAGVLLELMEEERTPTPDGSGRVFAGWYKDKTFAKGKEWNFDTDTVQSDLTLYACWLTAAAEDGNGMKLCVQEIPDLTYTGSALKPAVTVYDGDGKTLLKAGKDYTVKYVNNTNAVKMEESGIPIETGGTAKVTNPGKKNEDCKNVAGHFTKDCPYVVITGKGNYAETVYRNFMILPARISGEDMTGKAADTGTQTYDTPLAAGFTMKYADQLVVNGKKDQKPFSSMKYKKGMKAGTDYMLSLKAVEAQDAAGNTVPAG